MNYSFTARVCKYDTKSIECNNSILHFLYLLFYSLRHPYISICSLYTHSNHSHIASLHHCIPLLHIIDFLSFLVSFTLQKQFRLHSQAQNVYIAVVLKSTTHFSHQNFRANYFDRLHFCFLQALYHEPQSSRQDSLRLQSPARIPSSSLFTCGAVSPCARGRTFHPRRSRATSLRGVRSALSPGAPATTHLRHVHTQTHTS